MLVGVQASDVNNAEAADFINYYINSNKTTIINIEESLHLMSAACKNGSVAVQSTSNSPSTDDHQHHRSESPPTLPEDLTSSTASTQTSQ